MRSQWKTVRAKYGAARCSICPVGKRLLYLYLLFTMTQIIFWLFCRVFVKSIGIWNCGFGRIYWRNPEWKTSFFVQFIRIECGRESNAFDKSVSKAPHTPFLSRHYFHFSIITSKQCCALWLFQNPHWHLEKNCSKSIVNNCQKINLLKILEIAG